MEPPIFQCEDYHDSGNVLDHTAAELENNFSVSLFTYVGPRQEPLYASVFSHQIHSLTPRAQSKFQMYALNRGQLSARHHLCSHLVYAGVHPSQRASPHFSDQCRRFPLATRGALTAHLCWTQNIFLETSLREIELGLANKFDIHFLLRERVVGIWSYQSA